MKYLIVIAALFISNLMYRGDIVSGTYSPTPSGDSNLDTGPTMADAQYMRVGNTVTVSGSFTANPTVALTATLFLSTIPIPSAFATPGECGGVISGDALSEPGVIFGNATDQIKFSWVSASVSDHAYYYTYTYQIVE